MAEIAARLVKALRKHKTRKVVDLAEFRAACEEAQKLGESIMDEELYAELHPAHALVVFAQNQIAAFVEVLSVLPELSRFADANPSTIHVPTLLRVRQPCGICPSC